MSQLEGNGDNDLVFVGNLGEAPVWRTTRSGQQVLNIRLASTRTFQKPDGEWGEKTTWMTVQLWGAAAVNFAESDVAVQGARIIALGELVPDSYTNSEGIEIDTVAIRARELAFSTRWRSIKGEWVALDAETGNPLPEG